MPDFLKSLSCGCQYICFLHVCVSTLEGISGMIWTLYDPLSNFYCSVLALVIDLIHGYDSSYEICCWQQPNKTKIMLYKSILPTVSLRQDGAL